MQVANADRLAVLDDHAGDQGIGLDGEICTAGRGMKVGVGRRPPAASLLGHLVVPDAILAGAVEVVVLRQAGSLRRGDERPGQAALGLQVLDAERPGSAMVGGRAAGVGLGAQEIRQQVGITPALAAVVVPPGVVVEPTAADVDHCVHGRRAADDPAPGPVDRATACAVLHGGLVVPVVRALVEQASRLQQQDSRVRVLGKARCQHAPGAASADNDEVVHGLSFRAGRRLRERKPMDTLLIRDARARSGRRFRGARREYRPRPLVEAGP